MKKINPDIRCQDFLDKIKETVKYITAGETELLNSATNVQVFKVK